ncbi:class I SAM-dependent methyltransferase [Streptomyces spororaveus]|uniref:Methyltransferase n=1 Tax=Streptomyces spororaveus TaxID=284039 RepID=A0ABQ3TMU0_9ACTN|nr:class I SAM-dependent methyltransferase [Streptomyces spororaveus]MCM9078048.1 methyltransferase domain-containing protein [Streptomyces spororaveus]GHI81652.1 methyltransferase [Streptomyces spororaveus]
MWATGEAYEPYVGRWSRLVADRFVRETAAPGGGRWLDVGCGTGAVTRAVLDLARPAAVVGVDPSRGYVDYARRHIVDRRARFVLADATRLPFPDATASVAVSGLVLNFVPDPARAAAELARVVVPGGRVGVYVWDYGQGGMEAIRAFWDAAVALDGEARTRDEGTRFPLCAPGPLGELLAGAGLEDVEVEEIRVPTAFADFDDYWTPFLGGQGPAPAYLSQLPGEHRAELRERLRAALPRAADGSIPLHARAWAARARRRAD